jgi:hypothetical protein
MARGTGGLYELLAGTGARHFVCGSEFDFRHRLNSGVGLFRIDPLRVVTNHNGQRDDDGDADGGADEKRDKIEFVFVGHGCSSESMKGMERSARL